MYQKLSYVKDSDVPSRILNAAQGKQVNPDITNRVPQGLREITPMALGLRLPTITGQRKCMFTMWAVTITLSNSDRHNH